jgi:hypothetical protein
MRLGALITHRFCWAVIMALIGAVVGGFVCFLDFSLTHAGVFKLSGFTFTVTYFALMGVALGNLAADFIGIFLTTILIGICGLLGYAYAPERGTMSPWPAVVCIVVWFIGVIYFLRH